MTRLSAYFDDRSTELQDSDPAVLPRPSSAAAAAQYLGNIARRFTARSMLENLGTQHSSGTEPLREAAFLPVSR
jgi:hypothetical protein